MSTGAQTCASNWPASRPDWHREWRACVAIVGIAASNRLSQGGNWLSWLLLVLGLPLTALVGVTDGDWAKAVGIGAGIPLSFLAWLWWHYLIEGIRLQNHPAGYKLVTGMVRRSRLTLLVLWAALSLSTGLVLALAVGTPLLSILGAGLVLAVSGALIRWQFSVIFSLVCVTPYLWTRLGLEPVGFAARIDASALIALAVVLLLVCGMVISSALGRVAPLRAGRLPMAHIPLYGRFLGADCARGDRIRLLMHVLGPQAHTKTQALVVAMVLVAGALTIALANMPLAVARIFFLSLAVALQFAVADRLASVIYARHREQALLRLAVHAPDARTLNVVLSAAIARQFLAWWGVTTVLALVLVFLSAVPVDELVSLLAVFCLTLLAGGRALRDYARRRQDSRYDKAGVVTLFILTNVMLMVAVSRSLATGWWVLLAVLAAAAGAAFMATRLRAMRRAPAAFPAGRIG